MSTPQQRGYDSPRRRAQAEATRASILAAAGALLVERGWAGTTMRDVAREAGVSEPTVYAAYQNKAGLASALFDDIASYADRDRQAADLAEAEGDPATQLAAMIAFDQRLYRYGADVLAMLRDAAADHADLPDSYARGRATGAALRNKIFKTWPDGTLRPGMQRREAVDTYAAICNVDVYRTLTGERGWSSARVERWFHTTLCRLLLA